MALTGVAGDEPLDHYDSRMRPLGTATRTEVHARGLWHRTVHIWLAAPDHGGSLVFQLRSPLAADNRGLLDATAAGHVRAGESVADTFRETEEELGIRVPPASAALLGVRREIADHADGTRNREFQSVYLAIYDSAWGRFDPRDGEAGGIAWVPNAAGMNLARHRIDSARCSALIAGETGIFAQEMDVKKASFVPRTGNYYFAVHACARRLLLRSASKG